MAKTKSSLPSLLEVFQNMRLPNLGATRRVGDQAVARAKFNLSAGFGGGSYYILEFDHSETAYAIYVSPEGDIRDSHFVTVKAFPDDPSGAILLDGKMARLDKDYPSEPVVKLRKRLAQEQENKQP